ncbi:Ser-Thr-rich glycosyl-phosphatidyl-inositol-anchored membrane family-domain-containing protein [Aspergillus spectabilis]
MIKLIPFIIFLNSLVAAISITEPTANSTFAAGSTITVNWTTVDTDPSYFSLYLWNFFSWPPSYVALATDIPTADRTHTVQIPCDTNPEWGYQLSAINGTNVYIIYAQGGRFTVTDPLDGSRCVDNDPVPVTSATTCDAITAVSTVYITVSPSASNSSPSSPHHHHHHHSTPAQLPTLSSTTTSASSSSPSTFKYTKPGIVPKTIGWCSDYSHPVTLDHVPVPTDAAPPTVPGEVTSVKPVFITVTTTIGVPAPSGDARCPFV